MLTAREALTRAAGQLAAHPHLRDSAVADAALLLMRTLDLDRAALMAHPERRLSREEQAAYQRVLERRLRFEPMQYIAGEQDFYGLRLAVSPAVLIPRPETELLVEAVLARVPRDRPIRIADVGTGSGAIAIALAHHLPLAHVLAIDLSASALMVAKRNAEAHGLSPRIEFLQGDLLQPMREFDRVDAIISNPPYVALAEREAMHPQVRDFEPADALFSGETGLEIYERLLPQARAALHPHGMLAVEFGFGQRAALTALASEWEQVEVLDDLQAIPRVLIARSRPSPG